MLTLDKIIDLFDTGLRLLFKLSWLRECTGTFGDRTVPLAIFPQISPLQHG